MPANNSKAHGLAEQFPGLVGWLIGYGAWRDPRKLPYALDNGRFAHCCLGRPWDETEYRKLVDRGMACDNKPRWVVVPDIVGDACQTEREWCKWVCWFQKTYFEAFPPLALAVQDGMTPASVRQLPYSPDVIFVGGTTEWKRRTLYRWCDSFQRVHCGRVNNEMMLWSCHRAGCESVDGTGWFRGDKRQLAGLIRYLEMARDGIDPRQTELEFARTFGGNVPDTSWVE